jgi:hypothetical protein
MAFSVAVCGPEPCFFQVTENGVPSDRGTYTAQCSGRFPDYIDRVPEDYQGPRFHLSQEYPTSLPATTDQPWDAHDFMDSAEIDAYLFAVRDYIYDEMLAVDWVAGAGGATNWYHVPWMTAGAHPREFIHGLTEERILDNGELGLKPEAAVDNWAIGYYNAVGAYAIGQVWTDAISPTAELSRFDEGTVVVKVLFSDAQGEDFIDGVDILQGAPEWQVHYDPTEDDDGDDQPLGIYPMRLMQLDIAIRDDDAGPTGWIFGTFAYDRNAETTVEGEDAAWYRMMPVGLMWGNDPELTDSAAEAGVVPQESLISELIPEYASGNLGRNGRLNGPVDNPVSSCLSCHSTAQYRSLAPMTPSNACDEEERKQWFQNRPGDQPFGQINNQCQVVESPTPPLTALDYSLQMRVAFNNITARTSGDLRYNNPCIFDTTFRIFAIVPKEPLSPEVEEYPVFR